MAHSKDWPVLPWLKHDHLLQYEDGLDLNLRTALQSPATWQLKAQPSRGVMEVATMVFMRFVRWPF
jgi:hypothetical protein